MGKEILNDPWTCLFHNTKNTKKYYRRTMTPYLLNAAKGLIPKKSQKWLDPEKQIIKEQFERIEYIFKMEYLTSREEGQVERFNSIWGKWLEFKKSKKYIDKMLEQQRRRWEPMETEQVEVRRGNRTRGWDGVIVGKGGGVGGVDIPICFEKLSLTKCMDL